jgi:hypothetical protein
MLDDLRKLAELEGGRYANVYVVGLSDVVIQLERIADALQVGHTTDTKPPETA